MSSQLFAFMACISRVRVEKPSEGDAIGAVNVGRLIGISIDIVVCTEATDIEGIEASSGIETYG